MFMRPSDENLQLVNAKLPEAKLHGGYHKHQSTINCFDCGSDNGGTSSGVPWQEQDVALSHDRWGSTSLGSMERHRVWHVMYEVAMAASFFDCCPVAACGLYIYMYLYISLKYT